MNKIKVICYIIFYQSIVFGQHPQTYSIKDINNYYLSRSDRALTYGLSHQSIVDSRIINNSIIAVGTSDGLGLIDQNINFYSFNDSNLPEGGNPALVYYDEDLIVVSGVVSVGDLDGDGRDEVAGTGISWSTDNGDSWQYINQPQDPAEMLIECENLECEDNSLDPDICDCHAENGCSWNNNTNVCKSKGYGWVQWGEEELLSLVVNSTVSNVTYDLSVDLELEYIYAANWGGMLRRFKYTDSTPTWELVPLPMDHQNSVSCNNYPDNYVSNPQDDNGYYNHKSFSVYYSEYDSKKYIWAGTADGVNRGIVDNEGCIDWEHFTTDDGLAGNWVIDIVPQYINQDMPRIWLISWVLPSPPSAHGLSYSDDNGETWHIVHQFAEEYVDINENEIYDTEDEFIDCDTDNIGICEDDAQWTSSMGNGEYDGAVVYNLYFNNDNEIFYAATNRGLFYTYIDSNYDISEWYKVEIPPKILEGLGYVEDLVVGDYYEEKIYTCIQRNDDFFIGTPEGLIYILDVENINNPQSWLEDSWHTYIPSDQTLVDQNKLHIRPNPFVIGNQTNFVEFQYKTESNNGKMEIFNFTMELVDSFDCSETNDYGNLSCNWDGRNKNRIKVANGVYFCKLKTGHKEVWEKLMVINSSKGSY